LIVSLNFQRLIFIIVILDSIAYEENIHKIFHVTVRRSKIYMMLNIFEY